MILIIFCLRRVWIQHRLIVLNPQSINADAHHQHHGAASSNQLITIMIACDFLITIHSHLEDIVWCAAHCGAAFSTEDLRQAVRMPVTFLPRRFDCEFRPACSVHCRSAQHCTSPHSIKHCRMVQPLAAQHLTLSRYTALQCTSLHGTFLGRTAPHLTAY